MAVIFARLNTLKAFRELWQALPARLEKAVLEREEPIANARRAVEDGVSRAGEIRDRAGHALDHARSELERARRRECGPSQWHYEQVERCERAYDFACRQLERLERAEESFREGIDRCTARQDHALEAVRTLGGKGTDELDAYRALLCRAKQALLEDVSAGSGSFAAAGGGYVSARDLTEQEGEQLCQKTGWDAKMVPKCRLRPDGSVWLRTHNAVRDGETYNGTWFERDTVYVNDVRVEGIFPKFDAVYQPDGLLPEELWRGRSREAHFAWCRERLRDEVARNPALAARFTAGERALIADCRPLPDYTWHHHQQPGRMQLVSSDRHSAGMHGVSHTGGYALWCAGTIEE